MEDTFAKLQSAMVIQGTGLKGSKSHFNIDKEFQEDVTVLENPEERTFFTFILIKEEEKKEAPTLIESIRSVERSRHEIN